MERNMREECWDCESRRNIPGNCHIGCNTPDPKMTGEKHGRENGWFYYPECFDPIWKTKLCDNYKKKKI